MINKWIYFESDKFRLNPVLTLNRNTSLTKLLKSILNQYLCLQNKVPTLKETLGDANIIIKDQRTT